MLQNWYQQWRQSHFWEVNRPNNHFDTPSSLCTGALAEVITDIAEPSPNWIVELGAADGKLLTALGAVLPAAARHGVDLRTGPPVGARWWQSEWDTWTESWTVPLDDLLAGLSGPGLLVAVEWLDDLPCQVLGHGAPDPLRPDERQWLERWWPSGTAREVGWTRDRAWAWWAERLPAGSTMVGLDYGHIAAERPSGGSFTGFRDGHRVPPVLAEARRTNLTAAVAVDSLAAAVESTGARRLALTRLRDLPPPDRPRAGAADSGLAALAMRSQYAVLRDPSRFGDFWLFAHRLTERTAARMAG